ncbi:MAG: YbjQ family protein [Aestuariivirga sp.]|uniref:YbjQ family protein n=1 Tax=Aestuariivirga sp. TaxID=2650926 RepID=UPI0025C6A4D0|nr:YbjQ family protein [Aestuariivirga sp.]MCA3561023.1 YbjQ family protein [Aestuariivirga sp.]
MIIATTNDLPGYRVVQVIGLVRGITVRSRSSLGNLGGSIQAFFGGRLSIYVNLAEAAREEALLLMRQHAVAEGANAVLGMRYEANEIMSGVTEVLAYGTAVYVERL